MELSQFCFMAPDKFDAWWSYQRQITKKEDKKTKQQKQKQNHMKQE